MSDGFPIGAHCRATIYATFKRGERMEQLGLYSVVVLTSAYRAETREAAFDRHTLVEIKNPTEKKTHSIYGQLCELCEPVAHPNGTVLCPIGARLFIRLNDLRPQFPDESANIALNS